MSLLLTAEEMRQVERAAMETGDVTGLELMERAGRAAADAICAAGLDGGHDTPKAVVLCGPGNNGGDGFVIARLLSERGWHVSVRFFGNADALPPDARTNFDRWSAIGAVEPIPGPIGVGDARLVVDALFGTGLTRPIGGALRDWLAGVRAALHAGQAVCAVDAPSGLCMDSGRVLCDGEADEPAVLPADLTVTFGARKRGHLLGQGAHLSARLVLDDIGLPERQQTAALQSFHGGPDRAKRHMVRIAKASAPDLWKSGGGGAHKYAHGHALVLTGGFGRTGAARLAARGALRIGAGLVTLGVPGAAQIEVAAQIGALMMQRVDDGPGLAAILEDDRIDTLCLGPGLGQARARDLVPVALGSGRAAVLDADALSAFAEAPQALFERLHAGCVLTPHGGEFRRVFPDIAERLAEPAATGPAYSKVDATRDAAARAGCTVLFKGADTVIAGPDGECAVHAAIRERAAPWLATAGAGDVLAGFICGLMARGMTPMQAAETGAWLHVEAARLFGPGLIAEDLPETLPSVLRAVLQLPQAGAGAAEASSSPLT